MSHLPCYLVNKLHLNRTEGVRFENMHVQREDSSSSVPVLSKGLLEVVV